MTHHIHKPFPIILSLLWLLLSACSGCDYRYEQTPYPSQEQILPGPGEPCYFDGCRAYLMCTNDNICDYVSCLYAPDPTSFCGRELNVDARLTECSNFGCDLIEDTVGQPCESQDACGPNRTCFDAVCRRKCFSSNSCLADEICERSVCQKAKPCSQEADPTLFCADLLKRSPFEVECKNDICLPRQLQPNNTECQRDEVCASQICHLGQCLQSCIVGSCPDAMSCQQRVGRTGKVCAFASIESCHEAILPNVYCAIERNISLSRARCHNQTCQEVVPEPTPILIIRDVSAMAACQTNYGSNAASGSLLSFVGLVQDDTAIATPTVLSLDVFGKALVRDTLRPLSFLLSFDSLGDFCTNPMSLSPGIFTDYIYQMTCGGQLTLTMDRPIAGASLVSSSYALAIGRLRQYCATSDGYPGEDEIEVLRCREDVFDVGEEEACEVLRGKEDVMRGVTLYDLSATNMP